LIFKKIIGYKSKNNDNSFKIICLQKSAKKKLNVNTGEKQLVKSFVA